jgi:hypothetical protein
MLAKRKADRLRLYREFVSVGETEEILQVLSRKKWPWVLGSEGFVSAVKEKFFARRLDDEVPESRQLAPEVDEIKKAVCEVYGVAEAELLLSRRGSQGKHPFPCTGEIFPLTGCLLMGDPFLRGQSGPPSRGFLRGIVPELTFL